MSPLINKSSFISPLRYPGGKAELSRLLQDTIELNGLSGCSYYEPFAGGAGAALRLLSGGYVQEIFLNDADPCIYAFWISALNDADKFTDSINSIPLTIEEWHRQREIYQNPDLYSTFQLGFSSFFLNRCNRSGILKGAGPIGGKNQDGKWRLDARFNRNSLINRIQAISKYRDAIHISNHDGIDFLKAYLPRGTGRKNILVYADPPYISAGHRLYYNSFEKSDHQNLASYLLQQQLLKFIVSYDDSTFIRDAYSSLRQFRFSLRYSLQKKAEGIELIIVSPCLQTPKFLRAGDHMLRLKAIAN